jgi:hypothetical protein
LTYSTRKQTQVTNHSHCCCKSWAAAATSWIKLVYFERSSRTVRTCVLTAQAPRGRGGPVVVLLGKLAQEISHFWALHELACSCWGCVAALARNLHEITSWSSGADGREQRTPESPSFKAAWFQQSFINICSPPASSSKLSSCSCARLCCSWRRRTYQFMLSEYQLTLYSSKITRQL